MTWSDVEPIVKTPPNAKAYVTVPKDGVPRVHLSFSEAFFMEIGRPKAVDVQVGRDENLGKVRLVPKTAGKFSVKEMGKGGARVQIPGAAGMPDGAREAEACTIDSKSKTEVIISLPLERWAKQVAAPSAGRVPPTVPDGARIAPRVGANALPGGPKVDAVAYLANKGEKISRRGEGFMHNGDLVTRAAVLTIVNRYRRAAELEPVGMADIG